jgi:hypothetical protein
VSAIKVGDLVMVVRPTPCCNVSTGAEGLIFTVANFDDYFKQCKFCSAPFQVSETSAEGASVGAIRVSRLKRIPPLSELDDVKNTEELTA